MNTIFRFRFKGSIEFREYKAFLCRNLQNVRHLLWLNLTSIFFTLIYFDCLVKFNKYIHLKWLTSGLVPRKVYSLRLYTLLY